MTSALSLRTVDDLSNEPAGNKREKLNVNSPRGKGKQISFNHPVPSDLITSVNVEDEKKRKIQIAEESRKANEEKIGEEKSDDRKEPSAQADPPGCLACGSCFTCFFNGPVEVTTQVEEPEREESKSQSSSNSDIGQGVKTKNLTTAIPKEGSSEDSLISSNSDESSTEKLLPPISDTHNGRKCLVLDLDETLVHSSFQPMDCTFSLPLDINGNEYEVYVRVRPFVAEFIAECAKWFELVIFTASMSDYANPVIDTIDKAGLIKHRLFRESCVLHERQFYVKDLSRLGRELKDCIIIDNSSLSYMFNPTNAIGCTSWLGDDTDTELRDLLPVLEYLRTRSDVRDILNGNIQDCTWLIAEYGQLNHEK